MPTPVEWGFCRVRCFRSGDFNWLSTGAFLPTPRSLPIGDAVVSLVDNQLKSRIPHANFHDKNPIPRTMLKDKENSPTPQLFIKS